MAPSVRLPSAPASRDDACREGTVVGSDGVQPVRTHVSPSGRMPAHCRVKPKVPLTSKLMATRGDGLPTFAPVKRKKAARRKRRTAFHVVAGECLLFRSFVDAAFRQGGQLLIGIALFIQRGLQ